MATKFRKPLTEAVTQTTQDWRNIGDKSANEMRDQVQKKKFFSSVPYSEAYRKRKVARKAGKKGVSISSTSGVPDLTLSGKMMQALRTTKATTKNAWIGWVGYLATLVEGNARAGRDVTNQKLLDKVGIESRRQLEKTINQHIKKTSGKITLPVNLKF